MRAPISLALALGLGLVASSAAAQTAATPTPPAATPGAASPWGDKPVGKFHLVADVNGETRTATLTLRVDSAGTSRASVLLDQGETHEMAVRLAGPDLVLTESSPDGDTMTFKLQLRGDSVSGNWTKALDGGTLKGARTP
ncbi:MAG TPA: hypothetical protein VJ847_00565 [Gemmatimonadales bacterium]|jgi:hypothetical protein|nr:hypothetical protein [Gemmatimonadales bacterium]